MSYVYEIEDTDGVTRIFIVDEIEQALSYLKRIGKGLRSCNRIASNLEIVYLNTQTYSESDQLPTELIPLRLPEDERGWEP